MRFHAHVYSGGSAYSDMTFTAAGELACLFEKDGYKEIALGVVSSDGSLAWLARKLCVL